MFFSKEIFFLILLMPFGVMASLGGEKFNFLRQGGYAVPKDQTKAQKACTAHVGYEALGISDFRLLERAAIQESNGFKFGFRQKFPYSNTKYALHRAAEGGDGENVKELVNAGHSVHEKNAYEQTPLDLAQENGHGDIVAYLEAARRKQNTSVACCDIEKVHNKQDHQEERAEVAGWNDYALHRAVEGNNSVAVIRLIKAGYSVDKKNAYGQTPLDLAQENGYSRIVKCITDHNDAKRFKQKINEAMQLIKSRIDERKKNARMNSSNEDESITQ